MGVTIMIRKINSSDAGAFWQMQADLDKETKYMMYEPNERQKDNNLINSIIKNAEDEKNLLLVAEDKGEIIGFISAQRGTLMRIKHVAYIVIGIRKAYQGKGIGSEFFTRLNVWAKQQEITRLELTVMCNNKKAIHLYEKNGFSVEGIKKNSMLVDGSYVDEFYMSKLL